MMPHCKIRICVCYLITTLLISFFVYALILNNWQNARKLDRLKEDIDEIAHVVFHSPPKKGRSESLTDLVDNMLKKRLTGIWDELSALKKLFKGVEDHSPGSINGMNAGASGVGGGTASAAGAATTQPVDNSLEKLDGRVNYAADELGARVVEVKAEPVCSRFSFIKSLIGLYFTANPPIKMLQPSVEAGNCFAYKGDKAEITIQLAHEILLDQIAIQHITPTQAPTEDTSSAPKNFDIVGYRDDLTEICLGKYSYDNKPSQPLQYFNVAPKNRVEFLKFNFVSNHGNPNYTCVYRIAAYGKL